MLPVPISRVSTLGTRFALLCNLQLCNVHFKPQQTPSAPPGLSARTLALSELCRGKSCLPSLGLWEAIRGFQHVSLQTELVQQCSVIAVGMGTRSLQKTGAQMAGEVLVVWESTWAGPGVCLALVVLECTCVVVPLWVGRKGGRTEGEWDCSLLNTHPHVHSDLLFGFFLQKHFSLCIYINFRPPKETSLPTRIKHLNVKDVYRVKLNSYYLSQCPGTAEWRNFGLGDIGLSAAGENEQ